MAVGIVAGDALSEPEHAADAEHLAERTFDVGAGEFRVAVGVEEALLAGEEQAAAVAVDRAALEHHVAGKSTGAERARDAPRNRVVAVVRPVLPAPGVEAPVGERDFAGVAVLHENRAVVAAPRVVGRVIVKRDTRQIGAGLGAEPARPRLKTKGGVDMDVLETADGRDEAGEGRRDGGKTVRPRRAAVGPR